MIRPRQVRPLPLGAAASRRFVSRQARPFPLWRIDLSGVPDCLFRMREKTWVNRGHAPEIPKEKTNGKASHNAHVIMEEE